MLKTSAGLASATNPVRQAPGTRVLWKSPTEAAIATTDYLASIYMAAKRTVPRKKHLPGLEGSTVPGRITLNFSGELAEMINAMAGRQSVSKNSVAETLIRKAILDRGIEKAATRTSRQAVLRYARILIEALEEAETYDPSRLHNQTAPDLRVADDERFLHELRELTIELKRLNDVLEKSGRPGAATRKEASSLGKHFDRFFSSYAAAFGRSAGRGTWCLLIGGVAGLLHHAGVDKDIIEAIWRHLHAN